MKIFVFKNENSVSYNLNTQLKEAMVAVYKYGNCILTAKDVRKGINIDKIDGTRAQVTDKLQKFLQSIINEVYSAYQQSIILAYYNCHRLDLDKYNLECILAKFIDEYDSEEEAGEAQLEGMIEDALVGSPYIKKYISSPRLFKEVCDNELDHYKTYYFYK